MQPPKRQTQPVRRGLNDPGLQNREIYRRIKCPSSAQFTDYSLGDEIASPRRWREYQAVGRKKKVESRSVTIIEGKQKECGVDVSYISLYNGMGGD